MVAYSFQPRFVEPIRAGTKRQTIRAIGKRRHARAGEPVQLYTGMRTKACRKILEVDPIVEDVREIALHITDDLMGLIADGDPVEDFDADAFAQADGFADWDTMHRWWRLTHGVGRFEGVLIRWRAPT